MKNNNSTYLLWLSLLVIVVDQAAKYFILHNFVLYRPMPILPFLNFTLAYNPGAAFSFLKAAGGWQIWFFSGIAVVVSAVLIVWLYKIPRENCWLGVAIALILGGALSNLLDRIVHGYVIDFIDFHVKTWHWPTFNIADSAICIGAAILVIDFFFKKHKKESLTD